MDLKWILTSIFLLSNVFINIANATNLPENLQLFRSNEVINPNTAAEQKILALDSEMMNVYDDVHKRSTKNFLATHPVIVAQFNLGGGQLTLFRPGKTPLEAAPVPITYQLLKSVAHTSLATFALLSGHLENSTDQSWRDALQTYHDNVEIALNNIDKLNVSTSIRESLRNTLQTTVQFMETILKKGSYSYDDLQSYAQKIRPFLLRDIQQAASIQVMHWMKIVNDWKKMLGTEWNNTYGVVTTTSLLRQNNIHFTILAQFFGKEAINSRLFFFETTDFKFSTQQALDFLIRSVLDRAVGQVFFNSYYLMDYDITAGYARSAIEIETKKLGIPALMPPVVPFHSNEWPWHTDPKQGEGTSFDDFKIRLSS